MPTDPLQAAVEALEKVKRISASPEFRGVFENAAIHGHVYKGEQYGEDVDTALAQLRSLKPPSDTVRHLPERPKVVTLCGSTRFQDAFNAASMRLTLEGAIVIPPGCFGHMGDLSPEQCEIGNETKDMLDELHWRKIDLSDEILVLNIGGYIGESTRREIEYAERTGKTVRYLEEVSRV